jgi:hypothetical protein
MGKSVADFQARLVGPEQVSQDGAAVVAQK